MSKEHAPTLYGELVKAGIRVDNHYSDLYFPKTEITEKILSCFPEDKKISRCFAHADTKEIWYDVPFAYMPYWEKRLKHNV